MNKQIFTCISSTLSSKGGYIVKLQSTDSKVVQTAFGTKTQANQTTYYIKLDNTVAVGFKAELDLSAFNIVERPFDLQIAAQPANPAIGQAATPASMETVLLKWLQIK